MPLTLVRGTLCGQALGGTVESGVHVSKVKRQVGCKNTSRAALPPWIRSHCPVRQCPACVGVLPLPEQPFFPMDPHQPWALPLDVCIFWEYLRSKLLLQYIYLNSSISVCNFCYQNVYYWPNITFWAHIRLEEKNLGSIVKQMGHGIQTVGF